MEPVSPTSTSPSRMDSFRKLVKALLGKILGAPYLPFTLTAVFITTAATHLALILMNEPLSFWNGNPDGAGVAAIGTWMLIGPAQVIGAWLVYFILAILCLNLVNIRWSLIGWLTAEFSHLYGVQIWWQACHFSRWSDKLGLLCQSFNDSVYWFLSAILLGIVLTAYLKPSVSAFSNSTAENYITRGLSLAAITWFLLLISATMWSVRSPTYGWLPIQTASGPLPLQEAEGAYDTQQMKLIMFGGTTGFLGHDHWEFKNDTWEWDGFNWNNVSPKHSPSPRSRTGMAYDEDRGVVVLFGGRDNDGPLEDTWEWDGVRWKMIPKKDYSTPPARYGHEMYYDPVRKKVVLYGGYYHDLKTCFSDAWEWDGADWVKIELEGESPIASFFALAYNPDKQYALSLWSSYPGGTWSFQENTWTRLPLKIQPSHRSWTSLAYDSSRKLFVTFGGISQGNILNDTWLYDGKQWTPFTATSFLPTARSDMVIWYDHVRQRVLLFGGHNEGDVFNDTWELILPNK